MKNINKKNAFSLIELLAVIVILAIILLMATPIILNIVDSVKKSAFKSSVNRIISSVEHTHLSNLQKNTNKEMIFIYNNGVFNGEVELEFKGQVPKNGQIYLKSNGAIELALHNGKWCAIKSYDKDEITIADMSVSDCKLSDIDVIENPKIIYETFEYTGDIQTFSAPYSGNYKIELWGAVGGGINGGKGAYTSGEIYLSKDEILYLYVGGSGTSGGYNGGGASSTVYCNVGYNGGGGATDIRLQNGQWNDVVSLRSRIMVASGGAGGGCSNNVTVPMDGASGGTLTGINTHNYGGKGGTQTSGGAGASYSTSGKAGGFGFGGAGGITGVNNRNGGGGGGGYYGGGGGASCSGTCSHPGGSGSSYISGYPGVNSINETGIHTNSVKHFSNYEFLNTTMINGNSQMPSYKQEGNMIGNNDHGHATITYQGIDIQLYGDSTIYLDIEDDYIEPGYIVYNYNQEDISSEVIVTSNLLNDIPGTYYIKYQIYDNILNTYKETVRNVIVRVEYNFEYTGEVQTFTAPYSGNYKLQLWGAVGGGTNGGKGAYTSGEIYLNKNQVLYFYVGGNGTTGGYNGGGASSTVYCNVGYNGGGGATDIRLVDGNWNNITSLRNRIMVASGGAGGGCNSTPSAVAGASGGTLIGINTHNYGGKGGTQTSGGAGASYSTSGKAGGFGFGGAGGITGVNNRNGGGGGGGYYGGGGGASCAGACSHPGGSGSSYISGHPGVNSINESGTHVNLVKHFSNYMFSNTVMINGNSQMPNHKQEGNMIGNNDHGYARITLIG